MANPLAVLPLTLSLLAFGVCHVPLAEPRAMLVEAQAVTSDTFRDVDPSASQIFRDVDPSASCYAAVSYMARQGVMGATDKALTMTSQTDIFDPEGQVTRADAVTALYRLNQLPTAEAGVVPLSAGGGGTDPMVQVARYLSQRYGMNLQLSGTGSYSGRFSDIVDGSLYVQGVSWAEGTGLLGQSENGDFRPDEPIRRGELAVLCYRYAQLSGAAVACTGDLSSYWDGSSISDALRIPLSWAVESGVFRTLASAELAPDYIVTRGQLAQVLTALEAHCTGEAEAVAITAAQIEDARSKSQAQHAELQETIDAIAKKYGTVGGVQVAVIEKGRVTDGYAYGWADKTNTAQIEAYDAATGETVIRSAGAMTPQHKLRIASISKVAISMAAMSLAEEGIVDLDTSIGTYWGVSAVNRSYPNTPVSIRSIITHTSSIPMYGDDVARTYSAVQSRLASGTFSGLKPGDISSWGYNNYAYGVLGMTLELADGKVMDDILDQRFFDPLGMDGAFAAGELKNTGLIAALYRHDGSVARSVEYQKTLKTNPTPGANGISFAGGLVISSADLAKLVAVLAGDGAYEGQRVLSAKSVETMETPIGTPYGLNYQQCQNLRLQTGVYGRDRLYYHTGSAYGVYNLMSYDPDTGDGVVVLTTGSSASVDQYGIYAVCGEISTAIYNAIQ